MQKETIYGDTYINRSIYNDGPCWQNPVAHRNGFRQKKTSKHSFQTCKRNQKKH